MPKVRPKPRRESSDEELLKLARDYMEGRFTIASEHQLLDNVVRHISPKLTHDDVFEVFYEQGVETPEEGVAKLRVLIATREAKGDGSQSE